MASVITIKRPLPAGYALVEGPPPLDEYLNLRKITGLSVKTAEQGSKALAGSWYTIHLLHTDPANLSTPPVVAAMGRVIGDGGWYFHIVDMAVEPTHQRKGLGDFIMGTLLKKIVKEAPEGPYVNLIADSGAVGLYKKHGFIETSGESRGSIGMARRF